jgi:gluconate 5-dehydrogenase/3-oxoacyl-[acyl-carrier protein] reductase
MTKQVWNSFTGAKLVNNKVALITGGASGIGKAIVQMFADQGAHTIIVDLDEAAAQKLASEIVADGSKATAVKTDITNEMELEKLFREVISKVGTLDIVINNAGGGLPTRFFDIDLAEWNKIFNINFTAAFLISQHSARIFKEKKEGIIINISSLAGRSTSPTAGCHYTSSKAGILGMTRHMARELAPYGIRVNALCPGVINTERIASRIEKQKTKKKISESIPLGRIGEPYEVAGCCLFLASELSSYVTGATLDVNGGLLMI